MEYDRMKELIFENRGRLAGIALGLIFGWFAIVYGIFKAIFVCICIVAGYYIGKQLDRKTGITGIFRDKTREK